MIGRFWGILSLNIEEIGDIKNLETGPAYNYKNYVLEWSEEKDFQVNMNNFTSIMDLVPVYIENEAVK